MKLLSEEKRITIPSTPVPIDLNEFFTTRNGLIVEEDFRRRFDLVSVQSRKEKTYVACKLNSMSTDGKIRKELPGKYLSKLEDIALFIEWWMERKHGNTVTHGEGFLIENLRPNIFYVKGKSGLVFSVDVRFDEMVTNCTVRSWMIDDIGEWNGGCQIIFPILPPYGMSHKVDVTEKNDLSDDVDVAIKIVKKAGYKIFKEI